MINLPIYNAAADLLDRNIMAGRADKVAFIDPRRQVTYAQLGGEARQAANLMESLGLRREDRIVMVMLDTIEFPVVFLGAILAGIVPIPLNTALAPDAHAYMLADSRAKALFVAAPLHAALQPLLADLPDLEHVVVVGEAEAPAGTTHFATAAARQPVEFTTMATHPEEPAFWLYSSGSTGTPKGAKHVHTSPMATARLYAQGVLGIKEHDVCLSAAKLFFAYGLGNALSFPMSVGATTVLNPERPTPALMYDLLEKHNPTLFFAVPTLYAAMLGDPALAKRPGSRRLHLCVSAGEALPAHIGTTWKSRFGVDILDGVGSTELLHIFLSNAPGEVVYGTSGVAVEGYDLRLVDEKGAEVAPGEVGELLVRAPSAAEGYWNQREKSRRTFEGEWTRTGDKYTRDASGRYTYCGRTDDMFKVSGQWVSPFEVESALAGHAAVLEAAVIAEEDDDGLTKPKAFVVLKQGAARDGLEDALKEHVKGAIGAWKYPRWIEIVESLPKTATGKIQRFKLRGG
ncbi:MAG TPA: benzoate-CoA ligase family protein [Xanthobacteraceae bacterium]|nr:benzoate-CoA ligase family protein [Xanthobacteraceae bacterium]